MIVNVVIVGDSPSRLNINSNIAFVGSKCFSNVVGWIKYLQPDYYICLNSNTNDNMYDILDLYKKSNFKVIALGNKASERLAKENIKHFKLPHPSGLNRKLNDENYVLQQLQIAHNFIREINET